MRMAKPMMPNHTTGKTVAVSIVIEGIGVDD
jgi:hypothetical protein